MVNSTDKKEGLQKGTSFEAPSFCMKEKQFKFWH